MASQMASTPRRGKICVLGAGPIGIEMALRMVRSKAADHHVVLVERGSSFASNARNSPSVRESVLLPRPSPSMAVMEVLSVPSELREYQDQTRDCLIA